MVYISARYTYQWIGFLADLSLLAVISIWTRNLIDKIPKNWHYKKIIPQELKHILPSCKSTGKLISFCYSTIALPLSSYKQSCSIFYQSSPFCKVSPQPQMAPPCLSKAWQTIYWYSYLFHSMLTAYAVLIPTLCGNLGTTLHGFRQHWHCIAGRRFFFLDDVWQKVWWAVE